MRIAGLCMWPLAYQTREKTLPLHTFTLSLSLALFLKRHFRSHRSLYPLGLFYISLLVAGNLHFGQ